MQTQVDAKTNALHPTYTPDYHAKQQILSQITASPHSQRMSAFADYMGVPKSDAATVVTQGEQQVTNSLDRLTESINDNTNAVRGIPQEDRPSQPTASNESDSPIPEKDQNPFLTKILSGTAWLAKKLQPVGNLIPAGLRSAMQAMGQNAATNLAGRMGVAPAVAGRFGAAMGMAAAPVMAIIGIASIAKEVVSSLRAMAAQAWKTTESLVSYNPALATQNAMLELNREMRKFGAANAVAKGGMFKGADRIDAEDRWEEAIEPLSNAITILGNDIGTSTTLVFSGILEGINNLLVFAAKGVELLDKKGGKAGEIAAQIIAGGIPVGQMLKNVWGDGAQPKGDDEL